MQTSNYAAQQTEADQQEMFQTVSDLHKDARGHRPSAEWMAWFHNLSYDAQLEEFSWLADELEGAIEHERNQEENAWLNFQDQMNGIASQFGVDFWTAVRWDMDADEVDRTFKQDVEQYFWSWGLGFTKIDELVPQFMIREEA